MPHLRKSSVLLYHIFQDLTSYHFILVLLPLILITFLTATSFPSRIWYVGNAHDVLWYFLRLTFLRKQATNTKYAEAFQAVYLLNFITTTTLLQVNIINNKMPIPWGIWNCNKMAGAWIVGIFIVIGSLFTGRKMLIAMQLFPMIWAETKEMFRVN